MKNHYLNSCLIANRNKVFIRVCLFKFAWAGTDYSKNERKLKRVSGAIPHLKSPVNLLREFYHLRTADRASSTYHASALRSLLMRDLIIWNSSLRLTFYTEHFYHPIFPPDDESYEA